MPSKSNKLFWLSLTAIHHIRNVPNGRKKLTRKSFFHLMGDMILIHTVTTESLKIMTWSLDKQSGIARLKLKKSCDKCNNMQLQWTCGPADNKALHKPYSPFYI